MSLSDDNDSVFQVDEDGTVVSVKDGDTVAPASQPLIPIAAIDGTTARKVAADSEGRLRVNLSDASHAGNPAQFSAFGQLKVASDSVVGDYRFDAVSIPRDFDVVTSGTGGYSIEASGTGTKLSTGASGSSKCTFMSKRMHTYIAGRGMMFKNSIILGDAGVAGNVREWGAYDGTDGVFCRLDGTTLLLVVSRGGVEVTLDSSLWDTPVILEAAGNGHLFYFQYEWLGVGPIYLWRDEKIVHAYNFTGTSQEFSMGTPDLPMWLSNENTSNTSDVYLKTGCGSVVMEGGTIISGVDSDGVTHKIAVDGNGNIGVRVVPNVPPAGVSATLIFADTPLTVSSHDTTFTIPNGETFHLQRVLSGNEDPTKGASVEIIYYDGTTEHLVWRGFYAGFSVPIDFPDLSIARDGTAMTGDGSTKTIIVRRAVFTGGAIAIDSTVQGFTA